MENYFLSKRNYTLLYDIVKTGLYKQWNYDISTDRENKFLEKLRTVMKQIYNDRSKFNIDETAPTSIVVKTLNKYTLDFIIPHFGEIIKYTITVNETNTTLPPQHTLHRGNTLQQNTNNNNRTLMQRSTATRSIESGSVMQRYEQLNNLRSENKPHVPKPIDFSLPTGDKSDPSDKYLKMQNQRDLEIENFKNSRSAPVVGNVKPSIPEKTVTITNSGIEGFSNMNNQNLAIEEFNNMEEQKRRIDRSVESSLEELVAKRDQFFKDVENVKKNDFGKEDFKNKNPTMVNNTEQFLGSKSFLDDRNNGVFLSGDSSTVDQTLLFKEDVNIKTQLDAHMKRPEMPIGMPVKPPVKTEYRTNYITIDSRDKLSSTLNSPSHFVVQFPYIKLKNIREIKLLSAILPNEATIRNEPYILLSIPEIDGPMYSSNNRNMKIFNKLYNNKNTHNTSLDYLNYMPDPIKKIYPINGLGSLEQLTIQLHDHNGDNIVLNNSDYTSFTFEFVQSVADTSELQGSII